MSSSSASAVQHKSSYGRERARGDRQPGQAAGQLWQVHSYGSYDIECDTTTATPRDCALSIKKFLDRLPVPRAFDRLRSALHG